MNNLQPLGDCDLLSDYQLTRKLNNLAQAKNRAWISVYSNISRKRSTKTNKMITIGAQITFWSTRKKTKRALILQNPYPRSPFYYGLLLLHCKYRQKKTKGTVLLLSQISKIFSCFENIIIMLYEVKQGLPYTSTYFYDCELGYIT